jgi:hypothetical protein
LRTVLIPISNIIIGLKIVSSVEEFMNCISMLLTLSVRAECIYSVASQATSPDGVYVLRDFHKVVK